MIKLIIGPTPSGKSALGIEIARKINGVIINMDSMQIYNSIPIITAQPNAKDLQTVPHKLYGFAANGYNLSFGKWVKMLEKEVADARKQNLAPIVVGGTMMYAYMLLNGFSPIPEIIDSVRDSVTNLYEAAGHDEFFSMTQKMAREIGGETLHDKQRLIYNHCLIVQTGRTLEEYSTMPQRKIFEGEIEVIIPHKTRQQIYETCNGRFLDMINDGLLDEVRSVIDSKDLPIKRATGFCYIVDYLEGIMSFDDMVKKSQQETRNYAKKQIIWLRKMAKEGFISADGVESVALM